MLQQNSSDPLAIMRKMWGNMGFGLPGIVVPTLDADELEKRIADLKAVEGWLSMNLSMLQMTIRSLEMQTTTIKAVKAMGEMATNAASSSAQAVNEAMNAVSAEASAAPEAAPENPPEEGQLWPWGLMQQVQEYMQRQTTAMAEASAAAVEEIAPAAGGKKGRGK